MGNTVPVAGNRVSAMTFSCRVYCFVSFVLVALEQGPITCKVTKVDGCRSSREVSGTFSVKCAESPEKDAKTCPDNSNRESFSCGATPSHEIRRIGLFAPEVNAPTSLKVTPLSIDQQRIRTNNLPIASIPQSFGVARSCAM